MRYPASLRLWTILGLALLVALIYWPSTEVLYQQWLDFANITYTHGWLILLVSVWLVLRSKQQIAAAPARSWPLAQLGLAAAILAWLVCYRASIQDLHITIFPAILWFAIAAAFGWQVGRMLFFPVAFLVFALPSWGQLAGPLQSVTVAAMKAVLALTGPHASINGDLIHIPNGTFEIEEGCSGLHFMIVGLAVAALHGELQRATWRVRAAQLALMAALALVSNWVRVYVVIEAGYLSDMQNYLVRVSHYWFGWGVFAVALVAFFWLSTWFTPEGEPPAESGTESAITVSPQPWAGLAVAALLLALLPLLSALARQMHPPAALSSAPFLTWRAPWSVTPPLSSFWLPEVAGADDSEYFNLQNGAGATVEVFRARLRVQSQGAELVGESTSLLGRQLHANAERIVDSARGPFHETEAIDPSGAHSLIWWRYDIGGRIFVRPHASQLWYGLNAIVWNPCSALLALRVECRGHCEAARPVLQDLVSLQTAQ